MYRVVKEKGNNVSILIENVESKKTLNIGRITMEIIKILEEAGFTFGTAPGDTTMKEAWNLEITSDTKDKLSKLAMRMSKPVRDQSKKATASSTSEQKITSGEVPDLFDLIFGAVQ